MANRSPYPDTDDGHARRSADRPPGTPRWVKAFGIVAVVLVLLLVAMLLTGHGPGRHMDGQAHVTGDAELGVERS